MVYSKNTNFWKPERVFKRKDRDDRYASIIVNPDAPTKNWKYSSVLSEFSSVNSIEKSKLRKFFGDSYEEELNNFFFKNANRIIRFAAIDEKAVGKLVVDTKRKSEKDHSETYTLERDGKSSYYFFKGQAILFFKDRLTEVDGELVFGELLHDIWDDVLPNDLHNEGGVGLKKGKKPEKLLKRIMDLTTKPNDLVLDFFAGSGTSGAVAHKMNRQYILIEQMDYIRDLPEARLRNVIAGDQTGISKSVGWEGGGDFVYCELAKWNEKFVEQIRVAKDTKALLKIWEEMKDPQKSFLNYNVDLRQQDAAMEEFKTLALEKQKKVLIHLLDKNQLYVNLSEIEDTDYAISPADQKLNGEFYKS